MLAGGPDGPVGHIARLCSRRAPPGSSASTWSQPMAQVVATSEAYNSKAAAMGGIRSVRSLAADAAIEDQTTKEWAAAESARKAAASAKKAVKKTAKKASSAVTKS